MKPVGWDDSPSAVNKGCGGEEGISESLDDFDWESAGVEGYDSLAAFVREFEKQYSQMNRKGYGE